MLYQLPDGRQLSSGAAFALGELQYPGNWLDLASEEDRFSIGVTVVQAPPDDVTTRHVAAERDRRLALGFEYNFGDARGTHHIGTTEADLKGWSEVSTYAGALIDSGDITTKIAIATDTGPCEVTAPEWRAIEIASASFRQPLWGKSFALMALNPIPADYKNDSYWS